MSQDVIYTKITELTPISGAGLKTDDTFMISRPTGSGTNYVSYKCDYGQLSSAFVSSVVEALSVNSIDIGTQQIVQTKDDLRQTGNRLVAEKVIWAISQTAQSSTGQQGALLKKSSVEQTVEGPVTFTGKLQCGNSDIAGEKDVVNYLALENYVATAGMMPFFQGCAAEGYTTKILPDSKNNLNGILHKISADCIAQVILYSTQKYDDFCIFAYCMTCHQGIGDTVEQQFESIYQLAKAEVEANNLDPANYCVLQHVPLAAKKPVIVNLPMRKNNILCFFPKGTYSTKEGDFEPATGTKITKNTLTITVKEYRSFVG